VEVTAMPGGLLEELSDAECLRLLGRRGVGRVAVVVDDFPIVVPVNYRVVDADPGVVVIVRTQPGSVIDRALQVGFQVDGIDAAHRAGWSVLVRGSLSHLDDADVALLGEEIDPDPWVADRSSWLVVRPIAITGRRLHPTEVEWAFSLRAYL
jgi:hypothetical protein